jgi:hypothetical protein
LTKFIFKAFQEAAKVLGIDKKEKVLLADVKDILNHFPEYSTAQSEEDGEVLVSVPGEHDQVVYNVPSPLITVFPGEDHGLHSDPKTFDLLVNTFKNQQNEGGNDLVFLNLQAARIGMLDIERFKRQIKYSLLPNGTATDMVMQTGGRYSDFTDYAYMGRMGIWFENFGLPVVINECLMQSYNGTIRLFPNWPKEKDAAFNNLRAAGAFLVSAHLKDGKVGQIKIESEKGNNLKLIVPWEKGGFVISKGEKKEFQGDMIDIKTSPGESIIIHP